LLRCYIQIWKTLNRVNPTGKRKQKQSKSNRGREKRREKKEERDRKKRRRGDEVILNVLGHQVTY